MSEAENLVLRCQAMYLLLTVDMGKENANGKTLIN